MPPERRHDGRIVFLQPYLPAYRKEFFEELDARLAGAGLGVEVWTGRPSSDIRVRADATDAPWHRSVAEWRLRAGSHTVRTKRLDWSELENARLVVSELSAGSLETLRLLSSDRWRARTAVWGHVGDFTAPADRFRERVRGWQVRRAAHVFSYTEAGAEIARREGVDGSRITVTQNASGTGALAAAMARAGDGEARAYAERHDLATGEVALYLGTLDPSKRLPFLLAAGARIARRRPGFRLVVAGAGRLGPELAATASATPWLRVVGRAEEAEKAVLGRIARLLLMPGRVGLVAVDSFVLGLPIVTTTWPRHGPEFAYLRDGWNARIVPDRLEAFAEAVGSLLDDEAARAALVAGCAESAAVYTVGNMAENFRSGLLRCLGIDTGIDELTLRTPGSATSAGTSATAGRRGRRG